MLKAKLQKTAFFSLGSLSLGLGILGIFLPLLPTTPFILLSAACYAKGSERMHTWLVEHRLFGHHIKRYQTGKGMPRKAKVMAIVMTWAGLLFSMFLIGGEAWLNAILYFVGIGITAYMLTIPTFTSSNNLE